MLEGALILLAGVLAGRLLPARRRTPKPRPQPQAVCGCGHHYSFHAPATGACKGTDRRRKYSDNGNDLGVHDFACGCQRYAGPQPLPDIYAPEIGG